LEPGAVEVDRDMADQQVLRLRVGGDRAVIGVASAERHFAAHDEAGRGDYCTRRCARAGPATHGRVVKSGHSSSARRLACAGGKSVNRVTCTSRDRPVSFTSGTGKSGDAASGLHPPFHRVEAHHVE
jgi:hypothetical protein